jgi:hypothetical protein
VLAEWLKVKALSSSPSTIKKERKKERKQTVTNVGEENN